MVLYPPFCAIAKAFATSGAPELSHRTSGNMQGFRTACIYLDSDIILFCQIAYRSADLIPHVCARMRVVLQYTRMDSGKVCWWPEELDQVCWSKISEQGWEQIKYIAFTHQTQTRHDVQWCVKQTCSLQTVLHSHLHYKLLLCSIWFISSLLAPCSWSLLMIH